MGKAIRALARGRQRNGPSPRIDDSPKVRHDPLPGLDASVHTTPLLRALGSYQPQETAESPLILNITQIRPTQLSV